MSSTVNSSCRISKSSSDGEVPSHGRGREFESPPLHSDMEYGISNRGILVAHPGDDVGSGSIGARPTSGVHRPAIRISPQLWIELPHVSAGAQAGPCFP